MKVTTEWKGLTVEADVERGWEGDSSVPNGTNLIVSVEYVTVTTPTGEDISEYLSEEAMNRIEDLVIEEARA